MGIQIINGGRDEKSIYFWIMKEEYHCPSINDLTEFSNVNVHDRKMKPSNKENKEYEKDCSIRFNLQDKFDKTDYGLIILSEKEEEKKTFENSLKISMKTMFPSI